MGARNIPVPPLLGWLRTDSAYALADVGALLELYSVIGKVLVLGMCFKYAGAG
jgi:hypothetical protein